MVREEIEKKYKDVQKMLEGALRKADSIKLSGEDENTELLEIKKTLDALNSSFQEEIEKLKESSEWDKFCIAFFGETNSGKSTIIDSLRIIYDEETRRAGALAQRKEYILFLKNHCNEYKDVIASLEDVNNALKEYRSNNWKWVLNIVSGAVGILIGLLLANSGIIVW